MLTTVGDLRRFIAADNSGRAVRNTSRPNTRARNGAARPADYVERWQTGSQK
jgi:hypothetical protein